MRIGWAITSAISRIWARSIATSRNGSWSTIYRGSSVRLWTRRRNLWRRLRDRSGSQSLNARQSRDRQGAPSASRTRLDAPLRSRLCLDDADEFSAEDYFGELRFVGVYPVGDVGEGAASVAFRSPA